MSNEVGIGDVQIIVKKPKARRNYINGPDFHKAISDYYAACDANPTRPPAVPKYLGEAIMSIAKGLGSKINFSSYSFREELEGDAIEKMTEAIIFRKYDPTMNKNPLGYFSQISWNSFLQRIDFEKKEMYKKHKNFERMFMDQEEFLEDSSWFSNEDHKRIIDDFERPKERAPGYVPHRNLSYEKNKRKKKKDVVVDSNDIEKDKEI